MRIETDWANILAQCQIRHTRTPSDAAPVNALSLGILFLYSKSRKNIETKIRQSYVKQNLLIEWDPFLFVSVKMTSGQFTWEMHLKAYFTTSNTVSCFCPTVTVAKTLVVNILSPIIVSYFHVHVTHIGTYLNARVIPLWIRIHSIRCAVSITSFLAIFSRSYGRICKVNFENG